MSDSRHRHAKTRSSASQQQHKAARRASLRHRTDLPNGRPTDGGVGFLKAFFRQPTPASTVPEFWFMVCAIFWFSNWEMWQNPTRYHDRTFIRGSLIEFGIFALALLIWAIRRATKRWKTEQKWRLEATLGFCALICILMAIWTTDWTRIVSVIIYIAYAVTIWIVTKKDRARTHDQLSRISSSSSH